MTKKQRKFVAIAFIMVIFGLVCLSMGGMLGYDIGKGVACAYTD